MTRRPSKTVFVNLYGKLQDAQAAFEAQPEFQEMMERRHAQREAVISEYLASEQEFYRKQRELQHEMSLATKRKNDALDELRQAEMVEANTGVIAELKDKIIAPVAAALDRERLRLLNAGWKYQELEEAAQKQFAK